MGIDESYPCPGCGERTFGTHYEGGLKRAICERCVDKDSEEEERRERAKDDHDNLKVDKARDAELGV